MADIRIVVTGLGIVSAAGIGPAAFWAGMTAGRSFVRRITRFDSSQLAVRIAAEIDDALLAPHVKGVIPAVDDRIFCYSALASAQALADSGLTPDVLEPLRSGVIVGTSVGPSLNAAVAFMNGGDDENGDGQPRAGWRSFPAGLSQHLTKRLKLHGLSAVVSTGCASGADAIGMAFETIQWGQADVMFAMGTESPIDPMTINAFDALGALSRCNDDPEHASRPFDENRDGFVLGEGAAVLVLERLDRAQARRARIYGEVRGYATTSDAFHMTSPRHDLSKATLAVRKALHGAGVTTADVDYISAHATSTPLGDVIETRLAKRVFGDRAYDIPISSTKSVVGHQSGGAGTFQGVANLLTLQHQQLVPTANLATCGKHCDLDYVPGTARGANVRCILQHTFGFSGKNTALVYAHADYPWRA